MWTTLSELRPEEPIHQYSALPAATKRIDAQHAKRAICAVTLYWQWIYFLVVDVEPRCRFLTNPVESLDTTPVQGSWKIRLPGGGFWLPRQLS